MVELTKLTKSRPLYVICVLSWCGRSFEPREALPSAAALPPALLQTLLLSLHHIQCMWVPRVLGAFTPVSGFVCATHLMGYPGRRPVFSAPVLISVRWCVFFSCLFCFSLRHLSGGEMSSSLRMSCTARLKPPLVFCSFGLRFLVR